MGRLDGTSELVVATRGDGKTMGIEVIEEGYFFGQRKEIERTRGKGK